MFEISREKKEKTVKYMTDGIEFIIKSFAKRNSGSKGERETQKYFKEELSKYMDAVIMEDFKVNPGSFMGWMYITASCLILGSLIYFWLPIFSIIFFILGFFAMFSQLGMYKTWLDPFFKTKTSSNVYGIKSPINKVKRRLILCGHADAAYEWHWNYKYGFIGFAIELIGSVTGGFYLIAIAIAYIVKNGFVFNFANSTFVYLGLGLIPFVLCWIGLYFFSDEKTVVDGANDNLTACYMALGTVKLLREENINLANTELCVLITGSEEAGLRGARAFCSQHENELKDPNIETIVVVYETLREDSKLCLYTKEVNGIYKTDEDVAGLVRKAGLENGIDMPLTSAVFAGTDAAAFGESKIKSTCVAALDHKLKDYYHTRRDSYDNLNPGLLSKVLNVTLSTIENYDKEGITKA